MAVDLDLTRVSAPLSAETIKDNSPVESKKPDFDLTAKKTDEEAEQGQSRKELETSLAVDNIAMKGKLVIKQDEESRRFVQFVIDEESGDVIRQWPEEEFLKFAREAGHTSGVLVDDSV